MSLVIPDMPICYLTCVSQLHLWIILISCRKISGCKFHWHPTRVNWLSSSFWSVAVARLLQVVTTSWRISLSLCQLWSRLVAATLHTFSTDERRHTFTGWWRICRHCRMLKMLCHSCSSSTSSVLALQHFVKVSTVISIIGCIKEHCFIINCLFIISVLY